MSYIYHICHKNQFPKSTFHRNILFSLFLKTKCLQCSKKTSKQRRCLEQRTPHATCPTYLHTFAQFDPNFQLKIKSRVQTTLSSWSYLEKEIKSIFWLIGQNSYRHQGLDADKGLSWIGHDMPDLRSVRLWQLCNEIWPFNIRGFQSRAAVKKKGILSEPCTFVKAAPSFQPPPQPPTQPTRRPAVMQPFLSLVWNFFRQSRLLSIAQESCLQIFQRKFVPKLVTFLGIFFFIFFCQYHGKFSGTCFYQF